MNTDLTGKLPLREHVGNIRKVLKFVRSMDKNYFRIVCVTHVLDIGVPYEIGRASCRERVLILV